MRSFAILAALLLTAPAFAQVSTGEPDTGHNVEWRSPRYVAPKKVEVWTLYIVYSWPTTQVVMYPLYDSLASCEAVRKTLSFDTRLVTTSCGL